MFIKLASTLLQSIQRPLVSLATRPLSITAPVQIKIPVKEDSSPWVLRPVKRKVRNNWTRPSETKRVKLFSFKKRMSTLSGRKIIMRRILKGCSILTH